VNRVIAAIILVSALVLSSIAVDANNPVEIRVNGRYYTEPATVSVIVAVEPNARNRVLRLEADGEEMFRSSEIELAGDAEQYLHTIQFKNLAGGNYMLRAEVLSSSDSVIAMAEEPLTVIDR
jgi:hypothetical protein